MGVATGERQSNVGGVECNDNGNDNDDGISCNDDVAHRTQRSNRAKKRGGDRRSQDGGISASLC